MRRLEVFFDYACPYCLKGHGYLAELLPRFPDIEVIWRPCEAHPRPERYGPHSDLCIQGMFYALEQGVDIWEYHERMYTAALKDGVNIEDADVLAGRVRGLLEYTDFLAEMMSGKYKKAVTEANVYAWGQCGLCAVPSFRMDGQSLNAVEDAGVTKQQLMAFLERGRPV